MAIHSIILAWEIQRTEEPGELHAVHEGAKELDTTKRQNNKSAYIHTERYSYKI